jgi:hypothetical protein
VSANLLATILLSIAGDPGTHVKGLCTVDPASQAVEIDTEVPWQQSFEAAGLRCTFEADGRAVVEVKKNGSHSRSVTNGGRINVDVR